MTLQLTMTVAPPTTMLRLVLVLFASTANAFLVNPQRSRRLTNSGYLYSASAVPSDNKDANAAAASVKEVQDILLNVETCEAIAEQVQNIVTVPLVPAPLVSLALNQVLEKITSELDPKLLFECRSLLEAESTITTMDDASNEDMADLASRMAADLNGKIDIPYLNEEQEGKLLDQIVTVILGVLFVSEGERKGQQIASSIEMGRSLLGSADSRAALIEKLNASIDVPILDEAMEAMLLSRAVDATANVLESLLPKELIQGLQGETPKGIEAYKAHLIDRLNELVHLPVGFPKQAQEWMVGTLVDSVVDELVGDTEGELLIMSKEEQVLTLSERCELLERQIELSQTSFEQQQKNLNAQFQRLKARVQELVSNQSP